MASDYIAAALPFWKRPQLREKPAREQHRRACLFPKGRPPDSGLLLALFLLTSVWIQYISLKEDLYLEAMSPWDYTIADGSAYLSVQQYNQNNHSITDETIEELRSRPEVLHVSALKTNEQVIDFVSKTPNAIGVIGVNWLGNRKDTTNLTFRDDITVMAVSADKIATRSNSYKPYQAYLFYQNYPLTRPIYALLNDPRNGLSWGFASFLSSDKGQRIILKAGLVPATQPVRIVHVNEE